MKGALLRGVSTREYQEVLRQMAETVGQPSGGFQCRIPHFALGATPFWLGGNSLKVARHCLDGKWDANNLPGTVPRVKGTDAADRLASHPRGLVGGLVGIEADRDRIEHVQLRLRN